MNKKQLFHNLLYVLVGIVAAVAISVVYASYPSVPAPAGDTAVPINVGTLSQIKGDSNGGGLAVGAFSANQNAELDGSMYFNGAVHADPATTNNTISFGGLDPANVEQKVSLALSGGFVGDGSLTSAPLKNTSSSTICSDTNGNVVLCSATDVCANIDGVQATVPAGYTVDSNNQCHVILKHYYSILTSNKIASQFVGGVVNGNLVYQPVDSPYGGCGSVDSNLPPSATTCLPWVATLGLDNDMPFGWKVDDIDSILPTGFGSDSSTNADTLDADDTKLLNVTEPGSYEFKITSNGKIGIKGKFSDDTNYLAANFWLRIKHAIPQTYDTPCNTGNDQARQCLWAQMAPSLTGNPLHEPYPTGWIGNGTYITGNPVYPQFVVSTPTGNSTGGNNFSYAPYSFNFDQTFSLQPGDVVSIYTNLYGMSSTISSLSGKILNHDNPFHNSYNNFTYSIESDAGNTIFDVTETPQ